MGKRTVQFEKSNDRPAAVQHEIYSVAVALDLIGALVPSSAAEVDGYRDHLRGDPPTKAGFPGWLERELAMHETDKALGTLPSGAIVAEVASAPARAPKRRASYDVRTGTVRTDPLDEGDEIITAGAASYVGMTRREMRDSIQIGLEQEDAIRIASAPPRPLGDPDWQAQVHAKCDEVDAERPDDVCMIGADMGAPSLDALATHAEVERTFRAEHGDDEVTEVGRVAGLDERFDRTEAER